MAAAVSLVANNCSKTELLKGFIAQKLSSAAQEIFTVIERTVAAYEEEATGLRQEIDRQRSQLGVLHQLKLETTGPGVEDRGNLSLFNHTRVKAEEDEDDEDEGVENLTEPEEEEPERSATPSAAPDRITQSPFQTLKPEDHITLRIRILDPEADLTDPVLFRTYRLEELRCPPRQLEADFFSLLRTSFPQLAAWTHFDFFTEKQRELQPLEVPRLTPEEIYEGTGPRTIYIRPTNTLPEIKEEEEMFVSTPRSDDGFLLSLYKQKLRRPTIRSDWVKPPRKKTNDDICLKIYILDHLPPDMKAPQMLQKAPTTLYCPQNTQEADFLKLLRSSIPQLADQPSFNLFKANKKRKLQLIRVGMLTPAALVRYTLKAHIYIHPKTGETTPSAPDSLASDPRRLSLDIQPGVKCWKSTFKKWRSDTENYVYFQIRVLDPHVRSVLGRTCQKYPMHLVRCPRGLQTNQFSDLLRSTFPQLSAHSSVEFFRGTNNNLVQLTAKTPEKIQELMKTDGILFVKPKEQESVQSSHEDIKDIFPTPDQTELDDEERDDVVLTDDQDQDEKESGETEPGESDETTQPSLNTSGTETHLTCQICLTVLRSEETLLKHSHCHTNDPGRLCEVCRRHSESAGELWSHLQRHRRTRVKRHLQPEAAENTRYTVIPAKKKKKKKQQQQHMCNYCNRPMSSLLSLSDHLMSHLESGR
ncbi:uncharacterized protein LOC141811099 isoform X2 [Halichoeres trimaculatus]|uniref:uncharacterized protein LOC141811099 isoform X2 n=1 Tax=Halichoeres trimaculatus TaxID=147232 RepID=UPI003D9EE989